MTNPDIVARWRAKTVRVPGSDCLWWTGAISGRGHGRFWYAPGRVVIAHRFAWALAYGVESLVGIELLGHRCDNPLCQRIGPDHVVASSYVENRREWAIRKQITGSPLDDPRGYDGGRGNCAIWRGVTRCSWRRSWTACVRSTASS
ncbi:hypothetical protein [Janibacter alittae]|uniref:HNH endonuclease n=1 Tax=Janibacter alittae TaxID=3115209 RepID=A0ABZ2MLK0_9MICO